MSPLQSRERVLAKLGVRTATVRAGGSIDRAASELGAEPLVLARLVELARRDGEAIDEAASLAAAADGDAVTLFSTAPLRSESLAWAGVAHELRNALTMISGWAQVAASAAETGRDPSRTRHALAMVEAAAQDAMDVAPLLLEKPSALESAELVRVLEHVVERFAPVAAAREVTLRCRRIEDADVGTSGAALASIVANLVKNAIEACAPKGKVDVGARATNAGIEIIVEDDGRGMSEEAIRQRFGRGASPAAGSHGRGIGLSVVRALVERAGGTTRVTSRVGAGSCVRITLPRGHRASLSSGVRERSAGRRVLVVEDHAALRDLVATTLEARGATVVATRDPAQAIAAATEERFDVALVDLDLGERPLGPSGTLGSAHAGAESGAQLVRSLVATRLARRVVVMTGASVIADLGQDGVLRKPFDLADVEDVALESTKVGKKLGPADKKRRAR